MTHNPLIFKLIYRQKCADSLLAPVLPLPTLWSFFFSTPARRRFSLKRLIPLPLCLFIAVAAATVVSAQETGSRDAAADVADRVVELEKKQPDNLTKADSAWVMMASGLVMLMLPGLALFYGGMVRRKNILTTMMHSMV